MIILAAAIILSLSNSGIIGKANKAKTDSDNANLKEYVNTLRAEWELMTAAEQTAAGTFVDYANAKLAEKGYKRKLASDGKTIMNEAAAAVVDAGIKVGDTIKGYTVATTTYTTDGSENTASSDYVEVDPQPQTLTTNTAITWKYMGISEDGNIEIMAILSETSEITDTSTKKLKVRLSGKGGYLKGPDMLNTICEKLYSVSGVGTARSMNIDDVNGILGYIGPKGSYYDANGNQVTTKTPLTIGEIENKLGTTIGRRITPDGKDLETYYADYYSISKTSADIKNTANTSLVYNAKNSYWLASPCVDAMFEADVAKFGVRYVYSNYVSVSDLYITFASSENSSRVVRPVVKLDPSVTLTKDSSTANTWNITK